MSQEHSDGCAGGEQDGVCTLREALDRVGGKWSIGILLAASPGRSASVSWSGRSRGSADGCSP